MPHTLWVATRKGLFQLASDNAGKDWRQVNLSFPAEPLSMVFHDKRDNSVYAALNLGHFGVKLFRSTDNAATWTQVASPAFPKSDEKDAPSVSMIWSLEAAGPKASDGIWAGTIPGGLFFSADQGASWSLNEPLWNLPSRPTWFGGGYDKPGIHSICVDPRDPNHILLAISTAGVWRSRDKGRSWSISAKGMIAGYMPPERQSDEVVQDVHRMVQSPSHPDKLWVQHHSGIFKSSDCAVSWHEIKSLGPSTFGFGVAVHPAHPDTAWFVPAVKDESRIPKDARFVVTKTTDAGQSGKALDLEPNRKCYDIAYRHALEVDSTGNVLAVGSTTGHLWTSADAGHTFKRFDDFLPPIYAVRFA
jgi:hypothetical protein